ncbi:MAG TPA: helix-turn-helix domain-containing protein [Marmoricola sp.]|nr:helix-turn-helix domain-containing protein [Marmoricola sp.]
MPTASDHEHVQSTSTPGTCAPAEAAVLLTIGQAAAYLNVPARWVGEAARLQQVRCVRLGKHVRFRREHLDELIAAAEQPVIAPATQHPGQPVSLSAARSGRRTTSARSRL